MAIPRPLITRGRSPAFENLRRPGRLTLSNLRMIGSLFVQRGDRLAARF
jgi:hypothetical protein